MRQLDFRTDRSVSTKTDWLPSQQEGKAIAMRGVKQLKSQRSDHGQTQQLLNIIQRSAIAPQSGVVQLGTNKDHLHKREKKLVRKTGNGPQKYPHHLRRTARSARIIKKRIKKSNMGRNVFWATIYDGKKYRTFHLLSAGLGGKHPKSNGKSASHTEQMWAILIKRGFIKQYLNLKSKAKVQAIYSRNQACNKSPGNPNGCRSIEAGQMGMENNTEFHFSSPYATGKKNTPITLTQMQNLDDGDRDYDSEDEYVDTDKFRGKDMDTISFSDFKKAVTHNPKI